MFFFIFVNGMQFPLIIRIGCYPKGGSVRDISKKFCWNKDKVKYMLNLVVT